MTTILQQIISILVGGFTGIAEGIGPAFTSLAEGIFLTGTGESQTLSTFGVIVITFAAISLAMGLCRWVLNFITSLGARNR